jgi:hypothetical protein
MKIGPFMEMFNPFRYQIIQGEEFILAYTHKTVTNKSLISHLPIDTNPPLGPLKK